MFGKKGSEILKLPSVRNCFTLAMTNELVVIINSLQVPKSKKMLLYEMKFFVPNYSCLQNPWLGDYRPQIPFLSVLCPQLNLLKPPPPRTKFLGTPLLLSYPTYDVRLTCVVYLHLICWQILIMNRDKCVRSLSMSTKLWYETGNAHITCNIEARSRSHCCRGKAVSIAYSECVSARAVLFSWGSCADATSWG